MTNAVHRVLQIFQQSFDWLACNFYRLLERTILDGKTHDSTMIMVTVRVADIVLHVADDHVVPVGYVERSVFTNDRITRTEVSVLTIE